MSCDCGCLELQHESMLAVRRLQVDMRDMERRHTERETELQAELRQLRARFNMLSGRVDSAEEGA